MSFFLRGLHIASKQVAYLLIILATALMLLVGAVYWLADAVDKRQDEIAAWVGKKLSYPVEIGAVGLSWVDLKPKLQVDTITVLRQDNKTELLSIESIYVGLDLLASLQRGEPVLNDLSLTGLQMAVVRDQNGQFQLQGLNSSPESDSLIIDWRSWLNLLNRVRLQDLIIDYSDQTNEAFSGSYHLTNADVTHRSEKWITTGLLSLPSTIGTNLQFSGQWLLDSNDLQKSSWLLQAQIDDLNLAPFSSQITWQDIAIQRGNLTANISANGIGDTVETVKTTIDLTQTELVSKQENVVYNPVLIEHLNGQFDWQQQGQTWQLSGHEIQFKMNSDAWPTTAFSIKKQQGNDWVITSNYLRLSDITAVASLSGQSPEIIRKQKPAGDVDSLNLQYSLAEGLTKLEFNVRDGVMLPWQNYPGVTGLTASINWQEGIANLKLDSHQVTFYPETWLDDAVFFDSVTGELNLRQQDQFWTLQSHALRLWNDDLSIQFDGIVQHASDDKVTNDLKITVQDVLVNRWQAYVPQKILSDSFKQWSKKAFVAGNIIDGTIELKGDLAAFPYEAQPEKGHFKMALQAENVQLHYAPEWPDLVDVSGLITGTGNDLIIKSQHGKISGFNFMDVTTTINKLLEDKPILRTVGTLTGTTASALLFLKNSQLKQRFGSIADATIAQGASNIKLNLMVPLADTDATEAYGSVSFVDSQLQAKSIPELVMSKINGKLNFTNTGVTAKEIKASVFDEPVNINVTPKDDVTIVSASGQVSIQQIEKQLTKTMPKFITGKTAYEVNVVISEKEVGEFNINASVQSDLKGVEIDLPEPYGKAGKSIENFNASLKQQDNLQIYSIEYGQVLNTILAQDDKFWRGEINLGLGQAELPNHGVRIRGELAELSLDKWYEWSKQYSSQSNNSFIASMNDTVVTVGKLTGFHQQFTDLTISAKKEDQGWRANINSLQSKGLIYWPIDFKSSTVLKVELDKLILALPKSDDTQQITDEQAKFLWPSMDLSIGSLVVNDMVLGKLKLRGHKMVDAWLLDEGSLTSNEFTASIPLGEWRQTVSGDQSHFKVQANSDDLAGLLASFDYQQAVDAEDVYLLADLSWPDNPLAVSAGILNGSLNVSIGKGKLKDVEPGAAGRIFGLMSITALPRRLALDFSDLFSNGFYFGSIKGAFKFANGQAVTNDFVLKGSSATIKMAGPVDLINQQYNQTVTITPNVSSTLPLAGAVAAGPIGLGVGTAILLVDKLAGALFDKNIVNLISYNYYLTGPWDSPDLTITKPSTP
ncbi:MAG: TIGR02099 family protein [Pseudomonadota bacterium]|nr:TIGR02099 family protein [Pseudomonadota bacterium]MDO7711533.1 TIGR02099 family protein [Pseudomonadota bacterium]